MEYPTKIVSQNHKNTVFILEIGLSSTVIVYNRSVYNIMDLLGDMGGVEQILMIASSLFMSSYSQYNFDKKLIGSINK